MTGQSSEPTVDVAVTGGATNPNAYYGVFCRLTSDASQGYYLEVTGGGLAAIGDANHEFVSLSAPNAAILRAGAPNLIRGICSGGAGSPVELTLFVNGVQVLQTTRSSSVLPATGTVGIDVTNAGSSGAATVHFSGFAVRVPARPRPARSRGGALTPPARTLAALQPPARGAPAGRDRRATRGSTGPRPGRGRPGPTGQGAHRVGVVEAGRP